MPLRRARATCATMLFAAAAAASASAGAATLWRTPWMLEAPQQIVGTNYDPPPNLHGVAFADDGDLMIASNGLYGYADEFVSRFGADGALRWSGVVHAYDDPAAVVALPDGGAYATFSTSGIWGGFVARLDANGTVLWARDAPGRSIVPIDADRLAVSDCESASMLDAATGVVLWHRTVGNNTGCGGGGLVVEGSTIYAIARQQPDYLRASQRLVALDFDGRSRWEATLDDDEDMSLVGIGGDLLYLHKTGETIAVHVSDGSVAWRAPASGWILAGAALEPIVDLYDRIERLDAASGEARWTASVGPYIQTIGNVGDAILVLSSAGLSRIDAESGAILWTVALPEGDPDEVRYWDTIGGLAADGAFSVVARERLSIFVQRVDLATGALVGSASAPPIPQGIYGYSARDGSDLVRLHFDYSNVLRMIDVDAASGEIRWNSATQLAEGLNLTGFAYYSAFAIGPTRVAAAVPLNDPQSGSSQYGLVEVVAYDRATGATAWDASLYDMFEAATAVETPIVDDEGNVIVSIAMTIPCNDGTCPQQSIMKLAAADGSVLWRVDNSVFGATDPKPILAIGGDTIVRAPFAGSTATIRRLAGSDGSIVWESDVFAESGVANVYRLDDSRLVAFDTAPDAYRWAALDAATGAVLWTSSTPCADVALNCYGSSGVVASNGAIVLPIQPGANAALAELKNDGSGGFLAWPVGDTRPDMIAWLTDLAAESDGTVDYVLARDGSWMGGGSWYRRFDPTAGVNVSSQNISGLPLGPIEAGAINLDTTPLDSDPSGSVFSREDAAIVAHGNLAAAVTLDSGVASPGVPLGFHLRATYAGDVAVAGARFRGTMRWASGATNLSCAGSGVSNCVLDATGRDVHATFDIAPGGMLEISGRILPLDFPGDSSQGWIGARVLGPPELDESDTTDNFARANVAIALFAGGFDGN
jgi:outer membrane protein assembly factor BamB